MGPGVVLICVADNCEVDSGTGTPASAQETSKIDMARMNDPNCRNCKVVMSLSSYDVER